jgi:hypothetical protein
MLARLLPVTQDLPDRSVGDVAAAVREQMEKSNLAATPKPGGRIAIGVGSRGIANIATIVKSVVAYWKDKGFHPFIFPAMGSHGAATAEGQAEVLAGYGISQASVGCPVISSLEVVSLGRTAEGIEVFLDRAAHSSDGVMLLGRVKWHTDFEGKLESGLFKMMAIGLGKFAGARQYHAFAYNLGLEQVIRTVGRKVLSSGKILGGLAILEDARYNTAHLEVLPVEQMERREEELLALTKSWKAHIPVPRLDVLIVNEIGKNIMGSGMDPKVVNRSVHGAYNPWSLAETEIGRIFVRSLCDLSNGNAAGIGMADITHDRLLSKVNWRATWINCLTGSVPACGRMPMHFATDRECIESIALTAGRVDLADVTVGWIRNTLELGSILLSENLRDEIEKNPALHIAGPPCEFLFDSEGNLPLDFHFLAEEAAAAQSKESARV